MRKIIKEESEYQKFFKRELEKRGEDIEDMTDSEKKEFFNKIDRQWKAKDEAVRKKGSKKSGRSVAIIQKEYAKVISDMQDNLAKYKDAKNDSEKKPYVEVLKRLTAKKKKLQAELDSAVKGLYRGAELQINEATKTMKSRIRQIVKEEISKIHHSEKRPIIKETTVTSIKGFNLESDAYLIMRDILEVNPKFKKIVINAGIDLYEGANKKSVFQTLRNSLQTVVNREVSELVVDTMNAKRTVLYVGHYDYVKGTIQYKLSGILSLGLISSFFEIDWHLINILKSPKLKKLAREYSVIRGAEKFTTILKAR